jgi:8-oxo-dGTP pyrophosphatase MutT (NUDIX family)
MIFMNRNQLLRKLLEDTSDDTHDHMSALEKTGFWGSRGAGCIFLSKSSGKILLPYRSANVREGHTWGVWGGAINRDMKDPVDAVVQEVREETGYKGNYDLTHLSVFTSGSYELPFPKGKGFSQKL